MTIIKITETDDKRLKLSFPYDPDVIRLIRTLSERKYSPEDHAWFIPASALDELREAVSGYALLDDGSQARNNTPTDPTLQNLPFPDDLREGKIYVSWVTSSTVRLAFKYNVDFLVSVKALYSRQYDPETKTWQVGIDDLAVLQAYYAPATFVFLGQGMEKLRIRIPQPPMDYDRFPLPEFRTAPFTHQIEGLYYVMAHDSCLVADEQGVGKTWTAINAMALRKDRAKKCLVVCGVNSIKYNWLAEIERHSYEKGFLIDGMNAEKRQKRIEKWLETDAYFGVINIEALRSGLIVRTLRHAIKSGQVGAVIIDEIHKAKNSESQQGKAIRSLNPPFKLGLSGTPINKPEELFNILSWLGVETIEKEYPWRMRYCVMGGYKDKQVVAHKRHLELREKLQSVTIRRRKDEVLDLPPKLYQTEFVELTPAQRALYKEAVEDLILNLDEILKLTNPLTKTLRLRQITDGLFTPDKNPKLDRIREMLEDEIIPSGRKAIIFTNWRKVGDLCFNALYDLDPAYIHGDIPTPERQAIVDRFQNSDDCKVIIGTIGAMGTGLTLNAASYVFFIDKSWVPADNEQAEDRAHRIGTSGTVNIITLAAHGTIDEYIEQHVKERKAAFSYYVESEADTAIQAADILLDFLKFTTAKEQT